MKQKRDKELLRLCNIYANNIDPSPHSDGLVKEISSKCESTDTNLLLEKLKFLYSYMDIWTGAKQIVTSSVYIDYNNLFTTIAFLYDVV